jgi:tellurite resistance protein
MEQAATGALQEALAALEAKSAPDVPAYKQLVLDVAESVANAAKGVSASENEALGRIKVALGS